MKRCNKCNTKRCNCKVVINKPVEIITKGKGNDGLSAYELAVLNGYIGTEQEWLESLEGKDGGSYQVDEEDVTVSDDLKLHFKDRDDSKGLGYKILRLESGNTLSSSDFEAETIHEIRYDFDLDGGKLELPENVTLKFNGGSISNGEIVGDNTKIEAGRVKIFGTDVEFKTGSFTLSEIYPEWFGVKTFYINSNNLNTEALSSPLYNIPAQVDNLPDASIGINKALELSTRSTGVVRLARGFHKIENTVKMPMKSHLKFEVDSVFAVYMNGEGVRLMEHDEDTMEISELSTASEPIFKVKQNQFFHTDTMAHAIEVNPQQTEISGRGTVTLAKSRYTIGVLIRGHGFHYLDMSYGSPKIDIRVVGDHTVRTRGIDHDDIVGTGDPSEDIGVAGDKYWDKAGLTSWSKNNNGTWSILYQRGFADPKFNVHLRVDVGQGYSSGRLIDPEINIWGMFGWRGIEIWTHDGGWFNEGRWGGTISNIHGQCVAIYTEYDVVNHDMSMMTYQVDNNTQRDGGIFYAIKGGGIKIGNAWDMSWIQVAYRRAFYLGRGTNRITAKTYDRQRYVIDLGSNNFYDKPIGRDMLDFSNFETLQFYNLLQYRSIRQMTTNRQRGVYYEIPEFLGSDLGDIWYNIQTEIVPANEGTEDSAPKVWFDGTKSYSTVIDTDNNKYGFVLKIPTLPLARGAEFKGAVIIEYSMGNYVNNDNLVTDRKDIRILHNIGGESSNGAGWNLNSAVRYPDDPTTVGRFSEVSFPSEPRIFTTGGWIKNTYQIIIPIRGRGSQLHSNNSVLAVLAVNDVKPLKLNVHNLRVVVEGKNTTSFDYLFNPHSENSLPDSAPKGVMHTLNNTGVTFINKGDTENPNWQEVATEDSGVWEITDSSGMTSPNAEYSKIGKQVSLSGLLSFSSSYTADTNVQIVLPFTPKYGGTFVVGDLTFTLTNNSTNANVKSSSTGNNKPFNIQFKTA